MIEKNNREEILNARCLLSRVKENRVRTWVQGGLLAGVEERGSPRSTADYAHKLATALTIGWARTGWVIGRRRAVVIRHRKRINKCQVAQRDGGARTGVGCARRNPRSGRMLQIKFHRPPIGPNFSLISPFCDFSFLPLVVSLVSLSRRQPPAEPVCFRSIRRTLQKCAHTVALRIALRAERCIRAAFYFFLFFF